MTLVDSLRPSVKNIHPIIILFDPINLINLMNEVMIHWLNQNLIWYFYFLKATTFNFFKKLFINPNQLI